MRKEIVFLLMAAVLLLGGAAILGCITIGTWEVSSFGDPLPPGPLGDPLPPGPLGDPLPPGPL